MSAPTPTPPAALRPHSNPVPPSFASLQVQAILRRYVDTPVTVAADGVEAVEAAARSFFHCILMDVQSEYPTA